jgi:hypothetical protein
MSDLKVRPPKENALADSREEKAGPSASLGMTLFWAVVMSEPFEAQGKLKVRPPNEKKLVPSDKLGICDHTARDKFHVEGRERVRDDKGSLVW